MTLEIQPLICTVVAPGSGGDEPMAVNEINLPRAGVKPRPVDRFWSGENTRRSMLAVDMWASWFSAREQDIATCPTFDVVFERPRDLVPRYFEPISGLWIVDDEKEAKTSDRRILANPHQLALSVERAWRDEDIYGVCVGVMLVLYPRTGPYAKPIIDYRRERALAGIHRLALEVLNRAGVGLN